MIEGGETLGQPMPYDALAPLFFIVIGILMVATASIPKKEGKIEWRFVSGSFFLGIILIIYGVGLILANILPFGVLIK